MSEIFGTHDFGYGVLARALNDKFLLSAGFDGSLKIRTIADLVSSQKRKIHSCLNYPIRIVKTTNQRMI